jgi:hypothetical protein
LQINEREPPAYANEDPDDWWIRDIGVPTDHEVADLADAASGGVEDATAEQVGQRDRLVGDSPTSSDPIVQSGRYSPAAGGSALIRCGQCCLPAVLGRS